MRFKVLMDLNGRDVTCEFEVWEQAWIQNGRAVKVNCDNQKLYTLTQNPVYQREKQRTRRETHDAPAPGSPSEIDTNDEALLDLLNTHLKRLDTGSDASFELIKVDTATKQVVAGLSYKVKGVFRAGADEPKKCSIDIWTRPWIKGKKKLKGIEKVSKKISFI